MRLDKNRFDYVAPDLSSPTHRDITLGWVDKYPITAYNFIALDSNDNQSFWHFIHFAPWGKEGKKMVEISKIWCKSNLEGVKNRVKQKPFKHSYC